METTTQLSPDTLQEIVHSIETPDTYTGFTPDEEVRLFGTDLDYLKESGSFDIFDNDKDSATGALKHILIGDDVGGFHSTAAVQLLGLNHPSRREKTMVDKAHLLNKNAKKRRDYREFPFEPYSARVIIGGMRKLMAQRPDNSGSSKEVVNGMFPNEYDPVAIVRTINMAYKNVDSAYDKTILLSDGSEAVLNDSGTSLLLDGETKVNIVMILDKTTRKVITAYPKNKHNPFMDLDKQQIDQHLGLTK
jgi:hypothetical protein